MRSISIFRNTFEEMIDELLKIQLTSAPVSHSISSGIINHVNNNGTAIPYGQLIQSIKNLNTIN
jgi:translation initiation factor 6 (eIF-6)